MELKNFALAPYGEDTFILKSLERQKYTLLNNYQHLLFKQLAAQKHPLFVLFQPIGIQTLEHFRACFELFHKLLELGLLARVQKTEKTNLTIVSPKHLEGMYMPADVILGIWSRLTGKIPSSIWLVFVGFAASFGIASYIRLYTLVAPADIQFGFSFFKLILMSYLMIAFSFSWRSLLRASFLGSYGRKILRARFEFWGPFLTLAFDAKDIWLEGSRNRSALAYLGCLAPLSIVGFFTVLTFVTPITATTTILLCFPCLLACLLMLCPLHASSDGAELLHCYFVPKALDVDLESYIARPVFFRNFKQVGTFVFSMFIWSYVWTDIWQTFLHLALPTDLDRLYAGLDPSLEFLINTSLQLLYLCITYPFMLMLYHFVRQALGKRKEAEQSKLVNRQPLTFQEQNAALAKVPLFVSLSETEAKELALQMQTRFFVDGEALVRQGDVGDEFFILVRGKAIARYKDRQGQESIVGNLEEGDAFGEVALLDEVPRTASIVSSGGCYAVSLKKANFQSFISRMSSPDGVKQMIRLASFFKKHPLFKRLSAIELAKIIESLQYESLAPREKISVELMQENFYLVYSGRIKIDRGDDESSFLLGSEDCFGFSPLASDGAQGVVTATDGAGVLRIPKTVFLDNVWDRFLNQSELLWSK